MPEEEQLGAVVGLRGAGGVGFDGREDGGGAGFGAREDVFPRKGGQQAVLAEEFAMSFPFGKS